MKRLLFFVFCLIAAPAFAAKPTPIGQLNVVAFGGNVGQLPSVIFANSYGQAWLSVTNAPAVALPADCSTTKLRVIRDALALQYPSAHYFIFFGAPCNFGEIHQSAPASMYMKGTIYSSVLVHEFAHAMGHYHPHQVDCSFADPVDISCPRSWADFGDWMQIPLAHANGPHKEQLRWITVPLITTDGTFNLTPMHTSGGLKAIKTPFPNPFGHPTLPTFVMVEWRQDPAMLTGLYTQYTDGVMVHVTERYCISRDPCTEAWDSYALDMRPQSKAVGDQRDPALPYGSSYTFPENGLKITVGFPTGGTVPVTLDVP